MSKRDFQYSKKDPSNPTDILDRPIAAGDYVAFPTMSGRSARLTVGQITKINYNREIKIPGRYGTQKAPCAPQVAEWYTVQIQPMVTTSYYWTGRHEGEAPRPVTIQKVENIIKLELNHVNNKIADENAKSKKERDARDAKLVSLYGGTAGSGGS
jgi:hypothetical protein